MDAPICTRIGLGLKLTQLSKLTEPTDILCLCWPVQIGFVVCAIFGFHHHIVMKPLFAFLRTYHFVIFDWACCPFRSHVTAFSPVAKLAGRCCKCKCCGAVAADPGSFDPMWTTLPSPRKGGQGGRDASSGGGGTDDSELRAFVAPYGLIFCA